METCPTLPTAQFNKCLVKEGPTQRVLEKNVLPELHSILGFVTHSQCDGVCHLSSYPLGMAQEIQPGQGIILVLLKAMPAGI